MRFSRLESLIARLAAWSLMAATLALAGLVVSESAATEASLAALGAQGNRLTLAYYYPPDPASLESLRSHAGKLDFVAHHSAKVLADGSISLDNNQEAIEFLRASSRKSIPSVVAAGKEEAHQLLTENPARERALSQLVALAREYDGAALDLEGLDPADRTSLSSFIKEAGGRVREAGRTLVVAIPAKVSDTRTGWAGAYDFAALEPSADLYVLMAYGYRTSASHVPGPPAPLQWVESTVKYALLHLPPEKVLLGVPFYGYDWNVTQGPPARALRHRETISLLEATKAQPQFDSIAQTSYFTYQFNEEEHEVWYEDQASLQAKLELVRKYRLRGVAAWRLGQEDPRVWDAIASLAGTPW